MPRKKVMILHRREWDRLKAQASPPQEPCITENKYLKESIEKSQEWIKNWPDTVQGHIKQITKQKEKNHAKDIAEMKAFIKSLKHDNTAEAVAKAKQAIFESSCYGKQLLSALAFSKTQEERDAQIKFKKEFKNRQLPMETAQNNLLSNIEKREEQEEKLRKERNLELALINKSMREWDRLKAQASPPQEPCITENKYLKESIEKSQEWIKNWPDTVQGHIKQITKQKEKNHAKDIAEMKAFIKSLKHDNTAEAVAKAKQAIFESSCYGKQLLSALAFSKTQEERDAQIKFKKEFKNRQLPMETAQNNLLSNIEKREEQEEKLRKERNLELALINKSMYEMQLKKQMEEKKEEALLELEDARLMKHLLDVEKAEEERKRMCFEEQLKEYEQEQKKHREAKKRLNRQNDEKAEKLREIHDRKLMKIQQTHKQIYEEKQKAMPSKQNYKLIEEIGKEQQKRYEEFIEKGIKKLEEETLKKEQEENMTQKRDHESKLVVSEYNRIMMEMTERKRRDCPLTSDRQCIINIGHKDRPTKKQAKTQMTTDRDTQSINKPEFLTQPKNLTENLRRRQEEPTPWSALASMHAQFAKQAGDTLAECRYKSEARRVVDEYRKTHGLNATSLPVANY